MFERINKIEYIGEKETMDLEIDSKFHNFYANDICVSNSHSFAYSVLALRTLYLKRYYPIEFYCALLNHPKGNSPEEKQQKLMSIIMAAMNKGIEIIPPNRKSKWEWTIIDDKRIAMGYSSINGMGAIAFKELIDNNIGQMTKEQFFEKKWSKFNKKSFEVCVKAGLYDDWSKSREELVDLRTIKIADVKQYDLFTGEAGISSVIAENQKKKKFKPTPDGERYAQFMEVCNLDLVTIGKIAEIRGKFLEETGLTIEPITKFEDPNSYYYFSLVRIEEKTSERKGSKYYKLTLSDGFGTKIVNMWSNMYDNVKAVLSPGSYYLTKFMKQKGFLAFNAAAPFRKVI